MVVYPVPGRRVRCPATRRPVPDEGLTVPDGDLFWTRRLRDGDVTLEQPKAEAPPEPAQGEAEDGEAPPPPANTEEHA